MIGQVSQSAASPILLYGSLKFKAGFVGKLLNVIVSRILKLSFTLNRVLEHADDLKTTSKLLILLSKRERNLKPFGVNRNRSRTRQTHSTDIINYLTNLVFSVSKSY